jgi:hypothetical protein
MAKMTAAAKKAFLKRMSAGRLKAGGKMAGGKKAGALRSYVVEDERSERVIGTYRASSPSAAITACMRAHPGHNRANLSAHVMPGHSAGRVTGRKVAKVTKPRKSAKRRRAGSAGMVPAGAAMTARKGRQGGAMGTGTPAVRLQRVESAVMDLARANHAVVAKVVEHERRLNSVESTLSNWAKGRR